MDSIPFTCYSHYLNPPDPVEYRVLATVTLEFGGTVGVMVEWEQNDRLMDLEDDTLIAAMWEPLQECLEREYSHVYVRDDEVADIRIHRAWETL